MRACDLGPDFSGGSLLAKLNELDSIVPLFSESISLLISGILNACYGTLAANLLLSSIIASFNLDRSNLRDFQILLNGTNGATNLNGACELALEALTTFASALSYQGQNGGDAERHDLWHTRSAAALVKVTQSIDAWPRVPR